jgi:hypothetical protein
MSYDEAIRSITLDADSSIADYTGVPGLPGSADPNGGHQYAFVKVTAANTCGLADGTANEVPIGVLQNKPQVVGQAATVAIRGVSKAIAGAQISAVGPVKLDSSGRVITATLPADGALMVGVALQTAAAANNIIPVLLMAGHATLVPTHTH